MKPVEVICMRRDCRPDDAKYCWDKLGKFFQQSLASWYYYQMFSALKSNVFRVQTGSLLRCSLAEMGSLVSVLVFVVGSWGSDMVLVCRWIVH